MLDLTRTRSVVTDDIRRTPITVVGAGATGSWVVLGLAKAGYSDITVWDGDIVEAHNLTNQAYPLDAIGKYKVEALKEEVERMTGVILKTHPIMFTAKHRINTRIVFNLVDSVEARLLIADKSKLTCSHMVETRLGVRHGMVLSFDPRIKEEVEMWKVTLPDGSETEEVSACGTSITIGATATLVASVAWWTVTNKLLGETPPFMQTFQVCPSLET